MVRPILQILVLPVLFALLGAGGKSTFCDVLSVVGLEAHHHATHDEEERHDPVPICLGTHAEEATGHDPETVPCPDSCEFQLAELSAPTLLKLPLLNEVMLPLCVFAFPAEVKSTFSGLVLAIAPDPPEEGSSLLVPSFTGRFLV